MAKKNRIPEENERRRVHGEQLGGGWMTNWAIASTTTRTRTRITAGTSTAAKLCARALEM